MPQVNPLDLVADELASWADSLSTRMADAIKGGMSAPGAAQLSEQQKLAYYTRAFFNADGSPNMAGRAQEASRLDPALFAETFREVMQAHPELRPAEPQSVPMPTGPLAPDGLPDAGAVAEPAQTVAMPSGPIAPDGLPTAAGG